MSEGMFAGMDDVDWAVLEHAYGPAKDVPGTIRALASSDADEREKALRHLYGTIFHQGTRYQATAYAVPFLLELLADPATPARHELARLLVFLAVGYDEQWLPGTFPVAHYRQRAVGGEELLRAAPPVIDEWADDFDDEDEDEEDDEDDDGELDRYSWLQQLSDEDASALYSYVELAAYDAVRAGVPLFRSLLADGDEDLRTAAAYALAWFPEEAAGSVAALLAAAAEESSPMAAGTALAAAGILGAASDDLDAALADERELVRWGAAVALSSGRGTTELLAWAGGSAGERDDMLFLRGDIGGVAVLALRQHDDDTAVLDALLARLRSVSGLPAVTVLFEALRRTWPDGGLAEGTPFTALTDPQQRLLRVLGESPGTCRLGDHPGLFGNLTALLAEYGLPRSPEETRAYIDGD